MKAQKVRDLDDAELQRQLTEMEEQLFRLKFQMSMGQMEGLKKVRAMKKDRARIFTVLRERELRERRNNMAEQHVEGNKNEKVGEVVSTKMEKTIVVEVSRRVPHPLYKRIIGKRKKFYAHDEEGTAKMGDVVRIVECRPLSKLKRWRLAEVIRRAAQVGTQPSELDVTVRRFFTAETQDAGPQRKQFCLRLVLQRLRVNTELNKL